MKKHWHLKRTQSRSKSLTHGQGRARTKHGSLVGACAKSSVSGAQGNQGCVLRVLSLIFEAVQDNLLVSKRSVESLLFECTQFYILTRHRSIYYDNPDLFGTQQVVDSIVDDIAYTIGVDRAALHVVRSLS